jgi:predicted solute-binding protein
MTNENIDSTDNSELIDIILEDGVVVNINAKLLREYYSQAAYQLQAEAKAKEAFKQEVEAFADTSGLKKAFVSAYFKTRYNEKLQEAQEKIDAFSALDEAFN